MPMYPYECEDCKHSDTVFMRMSECNLSTLVRVCPKCTGPFTRRIALPNTPLTEFAEPIVMHSVGCNSMDEIREIQTKCPDVQISDDPNHPDFGVPVAKNRQQKLQVLKAVGFQERN